MAKLSDSRLWKKTILKVFFQQQKGGHCEKSSVAVFVGDRA